MNSVPALPPAVSTGWSVQPALTLGSHCPPLASLKHTLFSRRQLSKIILHIPATHLLLYRFFPELRGQANAQPQN